MALLSVALTLPGCAYLAYPDPYWGSRMADLADVFVAELSAGPGAHLHAQTTDFLGTGLGFSEQRGVRLHGRYIGTGKRLNIGLVLINGSFAEHEDASMYPLVEGSREYVELMEYGAHICADSRVTVWGVHPIVFELADAPDIGDRWHRRWWRVLDVSIGASALIGFHLCLSPGECVDSLLGWATVDLAGDDL